MGKPPETMRQAPKYLSLLWPILVSSAAFNMLHIIKHFFCHTLHYLLHSLPIYSGACVCGSLPCIVMQNKWVFISGRTCTDVHQLRGHAILVGFLSLPEWYNECMPLQDALVTMYRVGVVRGTRTAARILISNLEFTIHCTV